MALTYLDMYHPLALHQSSPGFLEGTRQSTGTLHSPGRHRARGSGERRQGQGELRRGRVLGFDGGQTSGAVAARRAHRRQTRHRPPVSRTMVPILLNGANAYPSVTYAEGFSGTGVYSGSEPGSPVIAVQALASRVSLTGEHRRGHGSLYRGRIDIDRLRTALAAAPVPRATDGRIVLAVDRRAATGGRATPGHCQAMAARRPGHLSIVADPATTVPDWRSCWLTCLFGFWSGCGPTAFSAGRSHPGHPTPSDVRHGTAASSSSVTLPAGAPRTRTPPPTPASTARRPPARGTGCIRG